MNLLSQLRGDATPARLFRSAAYRSGLYHAAGGFSRRQGGEVIRSINYHHIDSADIESFERQLRWLLKHFEPLSLEDVRKFREGNGTKRAHSKPGLIISFDDGLLSHTQVAMPVLDRLGVPGWFFVPTDAATVPRADQYEWAHAHGINPDLAGHSLGSQIFAPWSHWRDCSSRHVIASHTATHRRFSADVVAGDVRDELSRSYSTLQHELGCHDRIFCWVGGEEASYSSVAAREIEAAGTELAFTTCSKLHKAPDSPLRIERTNVEAHFTWDRFLLGMSGLMDLRFARRRKRLNSVLAGTS